MLLLIKRKIVGAGNQEGSALLAALGLTAVAAVIAIVVTSSSLFSVGYTTSTLAAVQSQAAAEAGIDFAAASLSSPTTACQATYSNSTAPKYTVAVSYSIINPVPSPIPSTGVTWVSGCPTLAATLVKFVSTGTANNPGLVGNSGGNTRRVEAVYPFRPNPPGTGAALYSNAQSDSTMTNFTITQGPGGATPSVQYLTAPNGLSCLTPSTITSNLTIGPSLGPSPSPVIIGRQCQIVGDLSAAVPISIDGSVIGNVTSSASSAPAITVSSQGSVVGNILAGGPVTINGTGTKNVTAGPGLGTTSITKVVTGSVTTAGPVTSSAGTVNPTTLHPNQPGMVAPPAPFVPSWVDYPYSPTDWPGYVRFVLSQADCTSASAVATNMLAATALPASIIDAMACDSNGPTFSPGALSLGGNMVIVANGLKFPNSGNSFIATALTSTAPHKKLWLIIPDRTADQSPTCPSPVISVNKLTISASGNVDAMLYSPCAITNAPNEWQGQIYVKDFKMSNGFTLSYVPMGLPGYNLANGSGNSGPAAGVLGTRTSIRNIV